MTGPLIGYIRWSSNEQSKGDSERRQRDGIENYAKRHNLSIRYPFYIDRGVSAFTGSNALKGELARLIDDIKTGRIKKGSILCVEHLDRLSRQSVDDALPILMDIRKAGIAVVTWQDNMVYPAQGDDTNPIALISAILHQTSSHQESKKKSQRLRDMRTQRREKHQGVAICPGWLFQKSDGSYDVVSGRDEAVRLIFRLTADGNGTVTVAKILNERGIAPFSARVPGKAPTGRVGTQWHPQSVANVLNNRAVLGEHQPTLQPKDQPPTPIGDPWLDFFPRVITHAEWQAAHGAKRISKAQGVRRGKTYANLFQGVCVRPL
jgi:DNA invertase Pin-like site-specific DNA recombinase